MKDFVRGGHGRTGTIISILIGILFGLNGNQQNKLILICFFLSITGEEALLMNSDLHDQRIRTKGIPSPESKGFFCSLSYLECFLSNILAQKDQVRTILDEMYHKKATQK